MHVKMGQKLKFLQLNFYKLSITVSIHVGVHKV